MVEIAHVLIASFRLYIVMLARKLSSRSSHALAASLLAILLVLPTHQAPNPLPIPEHLSSPTTTAAFHLFPKSPPPHEPTQHLLHLPRIDPPLARIGRRVQQRIHQLPNIDLPAVVVIKRRKRIRQFRPRRQRREQRRQRREERGEGQRLRRAGREEPRRGGRGGVLACSVRQRAVRVMTVASGWTPCTEIREHVHHIVPVHQPVVVPIQDLKALAHLAHLRRRQLGQGVTVRHRPGCAVCLVRGGGGRGAGAAGGRGGGFSGGEGGGEAAGGPAAGGGGRCGGVLGLVGGCEGGFGWGCGGCCGAVCE